MKGAVLLALLLLSSLAQADESSLPTDAEALEALVANAGQMQVYGEEGKLAENEFQMPMFIARHLVSTVDKIDDSDAGGLGIYVPATRMQCRDVTPASARGLRHYDCEYIFEMIEHKVSRHVLTPADFKLGSKFVVAYSRAAKPGAKLKLREPRVSLSLTP